MVQKANPFCGIVFLYKILGSIKNGVKEIIFPKENERDFNKFYEKCDKKYYII